MQHNQIYQDLFELVFRDILKPVVQQKVHES